MKPLVILLSVVEVVNICHYKHAVLLHIRGKEFVETLEKRKKRGGKKKIVSNKALDFKGWDGENAGIEGGQEVNLGEELFQYSGSFTCRDTDNECIHSSLLGVC